MSRKKKPKQNRKHRRGPCESIPADVPLDLRCLMEVVLPTARKIFLQYSNHVPMLFAVRGERMLYADHVAELMNTKALLEKFMVDQARRGATAMALVSECWMASARSSDTAAVQAMGEYAENHSLEDWQGRTEWLMVMGSTPDQEILARAEIIRPKRGRALLGPWDIHFVPRDIKDPFGGKPARFQHIFEKAKVKS